MTLVADATKRRVMPPWKPDRARGTFLDDRSLTDEQIRQIQDVGRGGRPRRRSARSARRADLRARLAARHARSRRHDGAAVHAARGRRRSVPHVRAADPDDDRAVRARDRVPPGNGRGVHHANLGVDRTRSSRRLDAADPEPGYVGGMVQDAAYPLGYMLGWTPGQQPRPSPDGMPWRLEADSDLVVQLHLQPTGKPEPIQVSVGLLLHRATRRCASRSACGWAARRSTSRRASRRTRSRIATCCPVDAEVLAVQPHAHNLGREMTGAATLPDGTTRAADHASTTGTSAGRTCIATRQPIPLPKGTTISMRFTVRQLRGESAQSVPAAAPDRVGAEHDGRNGRPLGAARARAQRGRGRAQRRHREEDARARTSPPTRACSRAIPTIRCGTTRWRCCICRTAGRRRPCRTDLTLLAQQPRLAPWREQIRHVIATLLAVPIADVNLKATSTEHLGFLGRNEGLAAMATVLIDQA